MMKFRTFSLLVTLGIAALLTGCFIPENFEASVMVNKDGSYRFTYDGTLTFAPALAATMEGPLSKKDEADFEKLVEELKKESGFKKVKYLGKGRYKVFVEKSGKAGEPYYFLSSGMKVFSVKPQQDNSIDISAAQFNKSDLDGLKSIGAKVNGILTVSVETGVNVIKHNAQSEPMLFGLFGGYEWEINSVDAEPFILVQPSS